MLILTYKKILILKIAKKIITGFKNANPQKRSPKEIFKIDLQFVYAKNNCLQKVNPPKKKVFKNSKTTHTFQIKEIWSMPKKL